MTGDLAVVLVMLAVATIVLLVAAEGAQYEGWSRFYNILATIVGGSILLKLLALLWLG